MTDEELQAIRERWFIPGEQGADVMRTVAPADQARDVSALLAEVRRLRHENVALTESLRGLTLDKWEEAQSRKAAWAENAAMREIVQAVASVMGGPLDDAMLHIEHARDINRSERPFSEWLDAELIDARQRIQQLREQARALLAREGGQP